MTASRRRTGTFIATREHRRFVEFADAVRRQGTIGLCHGPAGVGKTLSARRYANWDLAEPLLTVWGPRNPSDEKVYAALARSRTLFYTPDVASALRTLREDLRPLISRVNACIDQAPGNREATSAPSPFGRIELIVIDEAERLTTTALEYLRDRFDRSDIGLVLIGMPGIEKRLGHYPQLYSRVGFSHRYAPLTQDELHFVLARHWRQLGSELDAADFTDTQATAAVARLTGGNFRLLQRLFFQMDRVLRINELNTVTADVVEAAASALVIGHTT
ncbi:MAG: AAA family ATPase [Pseudomonadota bacterium]